MKIITAIIAFVTAFFTGLFVKPVVNTTFTLTDLAKHNNRLDCWTAIDNNVYNVTTYVSFHPGGDRILESCGKDATLLFKNAGVRGHMTKGMALLSGMKVGILK